MSKSAIKFKIIVSKMSKSAGKIQIIIPKMSKGAGKLELKFLRCQKVRENRENSIWNSPNVKKCGKFTLPKCQKLRENSNSQNPVARITISYISCLYQSTHPNQ